MSPVPTRARRRPRRRLRDGPTLSWAKWVEGLAAGRTAAAPVHPAPSPPAATAILPGADPGSPGPDSGPSWPHPRVAPETPGEPLDAPSLPEAYGKDRLTLMARDPHWIHAYWEITRESLDRAIAAAGGPDPLAHLALRVHYDTAGTGGGGALAGSFEIQLAAGARRWMIHGGRPGAAFEAEIGLRTGDGRFLALVRSNRVVTPPGRLSAVVDEEWGGPPPRLAGLGDPEGGPAADPRAAASSPGATLPARVTGG